VSTNTYCKISFLVCKLWDSNSAAELLLKYLHTLWQKDWNINVDYDMAVTLLDRQTSGKWRLQLVCNCNWCCNKLSWWCCSTILQTIQVQRMQVHTHKHTCKKYVRTHVTTNTRTVTVHTWEMLRWQAMLPLTGFQDAVFLKANNKQQDIHWPQQLRHITHPSTALNARC